MEILQNQKTAIERFLQIRKFTEVLCAPLSTEDFVVQPISFVSPPKWHLAHTSWFFENFILIVYAKNYKAFNLSFNYLFNSYYESAGERLHRSKRGNLNRPSYLEIIRYRAYINEQIADLLENSPNPVILQLTELGLQHEQQHQELLLTDIKYIFGYNPLFPVYTEKQKSSDIPDIPIEKYRTMPEGIYNIGYAGNTFCYDNELGKHRVFIESYAFLNRLVTNGEYLEFIEDGGYKNFRFWLSEGWEKVNTEKWEAPLYWIKKEEEWFEFTLSGLKKLNPNLPVTHISYYEAAAFAEWKGKRLLTEAEWEVAAQAQQEIAGNFIESGIFHPAPSGNSSKQLFGDCWEWTSSAYLPYPFYKRSEDALGEYNGKFMINQMVLRGGSCATPKSHIRASYRNFFPPEIRWQFSGIRLAENR